MPAWSIALIIVIVVILVVLVALYIFGSKMQKKSEASQEEMKANSQTVSLLVIDKKRLKFKEANLPKIVIDQTPKYLRNSKVPVVKAKIGPKIMNLMCDEKIFDLIPVKKEIKAVVSGIYIMDVKGLRSGLDAKPEKVSFFKKMKNKVIKKSN